MSIVTVAKDVEKGVVTAAKDVVKVVDFLPHAALVIGTAIKDQPAVKTAILALVKAGGLVIADGTAAATDKGINLLEDSATLAAAEAFFNYFRGAFLTEIESVYAEIKSDL